MSESNYNQRYSLLCLRLAAECRNMAAEVPEPDARAHFTRMAGTWTELANLACVQH
jgi:hypothetical protein